MSGFHAQLIRDESGKWFLNDVNSRNGVYVNSYRIKEVTQIFSGDEIKFGNHVFDFKNHLDKVSYSTAGHVPSLPNSSEKSNNLIIFMVSLVALLLIAFIVFIFNESDGNQEANSNDAVYEDDNVYAGKKEIKYDLSCLSSGDGTIVNDIITIGSEMKDGVVEVAGQPVSVEEEIKAGNDTYNGLSYQYNIKENANLSNLLFKLTTQLGNSKYKYEIFEIEMDEINAFTIGAKIFVTSGIIDFTNSNDELAAVIGHEIYHNELGHINKIISIEKTTNNTVGDELGSKIIEMDRFLTISFGQKDEVLCDLHGLDLMKKAGYDPCTSISLWERMQNMDDEYNTIDNLFRSHPYGSVRANCNKNHLESNYSIRCQ